MLSARQRVGTAKLPPTCKIDDFRAPADVSPPCLWWATSLQLEFMPGSKLTVTFSSLIVIRFAVRI